MELNDPRDQMEKEIWKIPNFWKMSNQMMKIMKLRVFAIDKILEISNSMK